jgi:hypothetical protein
MLSWCSTAWLLFSLLCLRYIKGLSFDFYTIGGIKNEEAPRMKNMNAIDRITRLMLATVLLELAYFWLAGGWQIATRYGAGCLHFCRREHAGA